jgi:hypothetical protein
MAIPDSAEMVLPDAITEQQIMPVIEK